LPELNWAGFYIKWEDQLVLGPFQGKPACVRMPIGQGICGTAAMEMRTIIVTNVHHFPGHIACDKASRSEIVVPVIINHDLHAILDLDSPMESRFHDEDKEGLESLVDKFIRLTDFR
jgi:GAF domain-containing protein